MRGWNSSPCFVLLGLWERHAHATRWQHRLESGSHFTLFPQASNARTEREPSRRHQSTLSFRWMKLFPTWVCFVVAHIDSCLEPTPAQSLLVYFHLCSLYFRCQACSMCMSLGDDMCLRYYSRFLFPTPVRWKKGGHDVLTVHIRFLLEAVPLGEKPRPVY
jgi:hypothetical protein